MKKRYFALLMAITMIVTSLAGCAGESTTTGSEPSSASAVSTKTSEGKYKIGVSFPTLQEERWQNDYNFFEEQAKADGNIELSMQVADNDSAKQYTQIESLISQGINALIVSAVDVATIGPAIQKAKDAGIYVIAYSRLPENCDVDEIVLFDNEGVAKMNAEYIYSLVPEGNYVILNGDVGSVPDVKSYPKGWYSVLQKAIDEGKIKVVMEQYCPSWSAESGMSNMENALAANNNNIQAVLCANDGIASGVLQALDAVGKNDGSIKVSGNDGDITACKNLIAGKQACFTAQDTKKQVELALKMAKEIIDNKGKIISKVTDKFNNGKMDVPAITCDAQLITSKEEIQTQLIDTGLRDGKAILGN
jgi:ABC-type xylose transport system, periplasmic component